jgi:hypothetical protein
LGQLSGACRRAPLFSASHNRLCNLNSKPFFAMVTNHPCNLFLLSRDQPLVHDAHAGRVHAANDAERAYVMYGNHEFGLPIGDTMV